MPSVSQDRQAWVADVIMDASGAGRECYTYSVPAHLLPEMRCGVTVVAPFGAQETLGFVADLRPRSHDDPADLKSLLAVLDGERLEPGWIDLARWMAREYRCQLSDAVRCFAPSGLLARLVREVRLTRAASQGVLLDAPRQDTGDRLMSYLRAHGGACPVHVAKQALGAAAYVRGLARLRARGLAWEAAVLLPPRWTPKRQLAARLTGSVLDPQVLESLHRRAPKQGQCLEALQTGPCLVSDLERRIPAAREALRALSARGLVTLEKQEIDRTAAGDVAATRAPIHTEAQQHAVEQVRHALERCWTGEPMQILLHGVTGSGKTEVYLAAVDHTLRSGRSAVLLVPEIALAAQLVRSVSGRFGAQVAVMHSALGSGERGDAWRRIRRGEARVVVGARSAVFAPVTDAGLYIIDEEHESAYKSHDQSPRYDARAVAWRRAQDPPALVLRGSATPSLESYASARVQTGALITLEERIAGRPMPEVQVVDMRSAPRVAESVFSLPLAEAIADRLLWGEQVILLVNRRAWAMFLMCRSCGYVEKCPNCAVSLAYHRAAGRLRCHHCEHEQPVVEKCPNCPGGLKPFGMGTERVQDDLTRMFPQARVLRMDRDTTTHKGAHQEMLSAFRARDADILVGTQMVAKGLDFPEVTLVGVVMADTGLNLPDFRAAERTFQLLTQVAGRAGRADKPGAVYIQTFNPEHEVLMRALQHDYTGFYFNEVRQRQALWYPPFSRLANVVCHAPEEPDAQQGAAAVATSLREVVSVSSVTAQVLGPAPAPLARIRGFWRWHVLLKAAPDADTPALLDEALARIRVPAGAWLQADIDPVSLM